MASTRNIISPVDAQVVPRYAGFSTYARLPRLEDLPTGNTCDLAVVGIPFDSGVTYRPGARFGPSAIREASRILRPYNRYAKVFPWGRCQVVDAGDISVTPFSITKAVTMIEEGALNLLRRNPGLRLMTIGGDHTIAFPLLKAVNTHFGVKPALIHFDAHLDTFPPYFGEDVTHGTPFRNAFDQGLFDSHHSIHVGLRGPIYSPADDEEDKKIGFAHVHCQDIQREGVQAVIKKIKDTVKDVPLYISIDIDVLDPAHAPGTGTPEIGGFTSRELQAILLGLDGHVVVGADVVEVAPAYDHAQLTALAASQVTYELLSLMCKNTWNPHTKAFETITPAKL